MIQHEHTSSLIVDSARQACLGGHGSPGYTALVAVDREGRDWLLLAEEASLGDSEVRADWSCTAVAHEQLGALPLDVVRRITIATRTHRCGRRTKSGTPCRATVSRPGDACSWHRTTSTTKRTSA